MSVLEVITWSAVGTAVIGDGRRVSIVSNLTDWATMRAEWELIWVVWVVARVVIGASIVAW